jgi:ZIP family zinc transporter
MSQALLLAGLGLAAGAATVAVLAHDLADGINTVSISLDGTGSRGAARRWLPADAAAPLAGVALSRFFILQRDALAGVLALFAGAFLYIGASELLPQSYRRHPRPWTTLSTGLGLGMIWLVVRLAQGG